jgi:hypothetical protein
MEEDGDLDMDLGAGADEQEMLDTPDERGQEIREIRGRSRARVKRGSGWYEPEKDRTSLLPTSYLVIITLRGRNGGSIHLTYSVDLATLSLYV